MGIVALWRQKERVHVIGRPGREQHGIGRAGYYIRVAERAEMVLKRTERAVERCRGRVRVWWHRSAKKAIVADVTASIHSLPKVSARQKFLRWLDILCRRHFCALQALCAAELYLIRLTLSDTSIGGNKKRPERMNPSGR